MSPLTLDPPRSDVETNEMVVSYPTFGRLDKDGRHWIIAVRGVVFEPGPNNLRKKLLVRLMRKVLKAQPHQLDSEIFRKRIFGFLVATARGKRIAVQIGSTCQLLGKRSKRNGHFWGTVRLPVEEMSRPSVADNDGWLEFDIVTRDGDARRFTGHAQLIGRHGLSVISDVDDTIKHSDVTRRRSLLANTFLHQFCAVPGMPKLYQKWADYGAVFHYVSSSPWQLFDCLLNLCDQEGFPRGTFHLRAIRLRDPSVMRLFVAHRRGKREAIRSIIRAFPHRRFVLVGDAGEKDPEIYGSMARRFPRQVARICIRQLPDKRVSGERASKAFRGVTSNLWQFYQDPAEIESVIPELVET